MVKPEQNNKIEGLSTFSSKETTVASSSSTLLSPQNKNMKKYKGVRMRSWGSYVSEVRAPNQKTRIWLGSYSTPEAAARAYDAALLCLKGPSANLNFPLSSYQLQEYPSTPNTLSPKSIQKVAALAAANTNFLDNTSTNNVEETPTPSSHSLSSSSTSSPSLSPSESSNQVIEGDLFQLAIAEMDSGGPGGYKPHVPLMEETMWCHFESPKYLDMLNFVNGPFFDQAMTLSDDSYEEGDITLWNFC